METLQEVFSGSSSKEIDFIQYAVFMPEKKDETEMNTYLKETLALIDSFVKPMVEGYIWQKDRFHLSIVKEQNKDPSYPFLFGASRFGDCINDEWFIVYILKMISVKIPEAVISLLDNDGDVLLIEAALELPNWLDPSNSDNRVYLHKGQVHLIPLANSPASILQMPVAGRLLRQKAIEQVRQHPQQTVASEAIQQAIQDRVFVYPAQNEIHRSRCLLPHKAAYVLLRDPQLITLAIEAFYLRDPYAMKACSQMKTFPPSQGLTETVIRLTKTTYAQATSQKFYPPKPFRLPSLNQPKLYRSAELGMKIACGLEMLYHTIRPDTQYQAYLNHLDQIGYFRSERPGSKVYRELEAAARDAYRPVLSDLIDLDGVDPEAGWESDRVLEGGKTSQVRSWIDQLLAEYDQEALEVLVKANVDLEDSDDWMQIDPRQLEELLMKRMGHMNEHMMKDLAGEMDLEEKVDLDSIMSNLEKFVDQKKSGVDGVVFPGEEDESDEESEYEEEEEEEFKSIQFDMDKFMSILKGTVPEEKLEDEEDLSQVMEDMDQEIYSHDKIGNSFAKLTTNPEDEEEDEEAPVDIQLNLIKNVLESFKSQQGLPGPVGNMLSQFGVVLPADNEKDE